MEKTALKHDARLNKHERELQIVFKALNELLNPRTEPMRKIGFKKGGA